MDGRRGAGRRAALAFLTSVVVALGGSGCSSDPGQAPAPGAGLALPESPSSSAPTTVASGTTSARSVGPAPVPAAARQRTPQGAQAFVRHFLAEYNRAMTSPRAQLLAPLGLSSCTACHNLEDDVKALLDEGVRYSKAPTLVKLVSGSQRDVADATAYHVAVRIARPRVAILNARNGVDEILEPRTGQVTFRLQWRANAWRVAEIEVIE